MCVFISWKEVRRTDGATEILFLTYDDIYNSKRGKKLQQHTTPDDFVGHGAIDFFYELDGKGVKKECTDFSSPSKFPVVIAEAIKTGKFYLMGIPLGLLSPSALADYEKIRKSAWADYEKIENPARADYEKIENPAWADYEKIRNPARADYEKIENPARADYEKIEKPARADYEKIRLTAFWELFFIPGNRAEGWRGSHETHIKDRYRSLPGNGRYGQAV